MTPKALVLALCLAALPLAAAGPDHLPHTHCEPADPVHHYALAFGGGAEAGGVGPVGVLSGNAMDNAVDDCDGDGLPLDSYGDGDPETGLGRVYLPATHHDSTICVADASGEPVAFTVAYVSTFTKAGFSYGDCITVGPDPDGWDVYVWDGVFVRPDGTVLTSTPTIGDVW